MQWDCCRAGERGLEIVTQCYFLVTVLRDMSPTISCVVSNVQCAVGENHYLFSSS